jgi:hypothetical protein
VAVVIAGRGLDPKVDVDVGCGGQARADARFAARVGASALTDVVWRSPVELAATVPAGLPPGLYDVEVVTPAGARLVLAGAYRVLGPGGDGGISDGGPGNDGRACETLYAHSQTVTGTGPQNVVGAALGAPDQVSDFISGPIAHPGMSWMFGFPASTLSGPLAAEASFTISQAGWIDDSIALEGSADGGATWVDLISFGGGSGNQLPTAPTTLGAYALPSFPAAPPADQPVLRIKGHGYNNGPDTITFSVDAVALRLCQ